MTLFAVGWTDARTSSSDDAGMEEEVVIEDATLCFLRSQCTAYTIVPVVCCHHCRHPL